MSLFGLNSQWFSISLQLKVQDIKQFARSLMISPAPFLPINLFLLSFSSYPFDTLFLFVWLFLEQLYYSLHGIFAPALASAYNSSSLHITHGKSFHSPFFFFLVLLSQWSLPHPHHWTSTQTIPFLFPVLLTISPYSTHCFAFILRVFITWKYFYYVYYLLSFPYLRVEQCNLQISVNKGNPLFFLSIEFCFMSSIKTYLLSFSHNSQFWIHVYISL